MGGGEPDPWRNRFHIHNIYPEMAPDGAAAPKGAVMSGRARYRAWTMVLPVPANLPPLPV